MLPRWTNRRSPESPGWVVLAILLVRDEERTLGNPITLNGSSVTVRAMRTLLVLAVLAAAALAGCAGSSPPASSAAPSPHAPNASASAPASTAAPAPTSARIAGASGLHVAAGVAPVSVVGHRTSEFTVAR